MPGVGSGFKGLRLVLITAVGVLIPAIAGAGSSSGAGRLQTSKSSTRAVVDHVADGDTIQVQIGQREEDVRFIGIDTPEVYGEDECGGPEASRAMKRWLKPGDVVKLIRDRTQDNRDYYGRILRYVEHDGRDLGQAQLCQSRPRR